MDNLTKRIKESGERARLTSLYRILVNFDGFKARDGLGPCIQLQSVVYILQQMGFVSKLYDFSDDTAGPHSVQLDEDETELSRHRRIIELNSGGELPDQYLLKEAYRNDYFEDNPLSKGKRAPRVIDILKEASAQSIFNLSKLLRYSEDEGILPSLDPAHRKGLSNTSGVNYQQYKQALCLYRKLMSQNPKAQVFI